MRNFAREAEIVGEALRKDPERTLFASEIETPVGVLTRIGGSRARPETPSVWQNKKTLFKTEIRETKTVVVHFTGEPYGEDPDYFQRDFQDYYDFHQGRVIPGERKVAPDFYGSHSPTMTLLTEAAERDLSQYFRSQDKKAVAGTVKKAIDLTDYAISQTRRNTPSFPRYLSAFLTPEYPFLAGKKIRNYLSDPELIALYKDTQRQTIAFITPLTELGFVSGICLSDIKAENLVKDREGRVFFIDPTRYGRMHRLAAIGQLFQNTADDAPESLFAKILRQKVEELIVAERDPQTAVCHFLTGRMNRLALPLTLRNLSFNIDSGGENDEQLVEEKLYALRRLLNRRSLEEALVF